MAGSALKATARRCPRYFRFTPPKPTFIVRFGNVRLHARITETPRSRVSFASTVLLNPIGSLRPSHAQKPNRHRARGTALRILSRDFLLLTHVKPRHTRQE